MIDKEKAMLQQAWTFILTRTCRAQIVMYGPPTHEAIAVLIQHLELMLDAVPTEAEAKEILRAQEEADQYEKRSDDTCNK